MTGKIDARLRELGVTLGPGAAPAANYVPFVCTGPYIYISGQVSLRPEGQSYVGALGGTVSTEDGKQAARLCAVNALAALKTALNGDLDRVRRVIKVTGFVNATPGFTQHPEVVNGASDLFVALFGEVGKHARAAVGTSSLPRNAAVEIEVIFEVS